MKGYQVNEHPLEPMALYETVRHRNVGAVVLFIGTVREMTGSKQTELLEYESYVPMAEKMLEQIGHEVSERWPGTLTAIHHRIGRLNILDEAVVIATSSSHRADAYEANRYAIERIKEIVPIWKREHWTDGTKWIGDQKEQLPGRPEGVTYS